MALGMRGFPSVMGGIETHCEHLYPLLAEMGCDIEALVRTPYVPRDRPVVWRGVRFRRLWAPKITGLGTAIHSFLGVLYAGLKRPDLLHIHGIGPSLVAPLARVMGLRVVITSQGPDYEREKWGRFARWVLRLGEAWGMRYSNEYIVVSKGIKDTISQRYGREVELIPNGVTPADMPETTSALQFFSLKPRRYIIVVCRIVKEKRQMDVIHAFRSARLQGWKLVLVGASDHPDSYTKEVLALVDKTPGAIYAGFQTGVALKELYANAGLFVLASSHEGLALALLEALSYGLPVLASRIPANLEIGLPDACYFPVADVSVLTRKLQEHANSEPTEVGTNSRTDFENARFDWRVIARQTKVVYEKACS